MEYAVIYFKKNVVPEEGDDIWCHKLEKSNIFFVAPCAKIFEKKRSARPDKEPLDYFVAADPEDFNNDKKMYFYQNIIPCSKCKKSCSLQDANHNKVVYLRIYLTLVASE